jgi:hypothetical protein
MMLSAEQIAGGLKDIISYIRSGETGLAITSAGFLKEDLERGSVPIPRNDKTGSWRAPVPRYSPDRPLYEAVLTHLRVAIHDLSRSNSDVAIHELEAAIERCERHGSQSI